MQKHLAGYTCRGTSRAMTELLDTGKGRGTGGRRHTQGIRRGIYSGTCRDRQCLGKGQSTA